MLHKKNLLAIFIVALFSFVIAGTAAAAEGKDDYQTIPSDAQNEERLAAAIAHAEEGLAAIKAGDGAAAATHVKASVVELREINSETWAPVLQPATGKVRVSGIKAKKGEFEKAIGMLEPAIATLKGLK